MPTIQDVAKKAGVAPITVSRVINQSGYIRAETRQRVEAAIAELGYVPNNLARSLRSKRTDTLALILTDITNPFFTVVARGVEDTASDAGFNVIFCNTDESELEEARYLRLLLQKQVDGLLLVPARSADGGASIQSIQLAREHGTPLVVLDRRAPGGSTDCVRCDSEAGAYRLVRLLLDLGHREIAILAGPEAVSTSADRVAGYRRALHEAGLPGGERVFTGAFTQESGCEMANRALQSTPQPTALFAANNFIAIGALRALQASQLRVPEDIALVGFDDLPPAMVVDPFLTVAAQPAYQMGQKATELLIARLGGSLPLQPQEIILPTEVIVRRSSGPQRGLEIK